MKKDARKCKKLLETTVSRREYNLNHKIEVPYNHECCFCPHRKRPHCKTCNNTSRTIKRNWKKYRKWQWK
jgi:hypothetical protein